MRSTGGSGGRDHDKSCKYASGAAKRKAKEEERLAQESKVLSKVPKISKIVFTNGNKESWTLGWPCTL